MVGPCEQPAHLLSVKLFPNQPTSVVGIIIIDVADVDPPCLHDVPAAPHGLASGEIIVHPHVSHITTSPAEHFKPIC